MSTSRGTWRKPSRSNRSASIPGAMRLSGVVPVALVGLVVTFASTGAGGLRPLHLSSPQPLTKSAPLALIWHASGQRLARIDERTLRVRGCQSRPLGFVNGAWAFERPNDRLLALATTPSLYRSRTDSIRFVRVADLKLLPRQIETNGVVRAFLWTQPDRLVA